ncbi:MAG TPA: PhzF family phenazine biosynthesis protein [Ignavibacteriaceae bacterium]|nr:PhzF family phenazine biosynthesis protein [Ignavibacteriaceae bacterium]
MRKQFEIYHINAFTKNSFEGNAAAVMFGDELSEHQMQLVANQTNYSETAFLCSSKKSDHNLRWFTPFVEVDLCGHATIAALHFLAEKGIIKNKTSLIIETKSGFINCSVSDDEYSMQMPLFKVNELGRFENDLISAYNIPVDIIDEDTPILTLSNNYVFVKIKSYDKLVSYKPKIDTENYLIKKFPDLSLYTTETTEEENSAHQRFFAPGHGITEDPVTGSAAAYLALVLLKAGIISEKTIKKSITIEQGDHLGRKGRVKVSFNPEKQQLEIKGNAVTFLKGSIFI